MLRIEALSYFKIWFCPKMTGMSYYVKAKERVSASVEIFNAIPSTPFSEPAKLRPINSNLWTLFSINMNFKTLIPSCSIHSRRLRRAGSFEGRFRKAKYLQCRSDILLRLYFDFVSRYFGTKPKI